MLAHSCNGGNAIIRFLADCDVIAFQRVLIGKDAAKRAAHNRMIIGDDSGSLCPECQALPLCLPQSIRGALITKRRYHKVAWC